MPNPIHRNALRKAEAKQDNGPGILLSRTITQDWASIGPDDITADRFFEIQLERLVTFSDSVSLGDRPSLAAKRAFTTLALIPRRNDMHGVFVEVVLYDTSNNTGSLGEIYNERTGQDASMRLVYGGQEIVIVVKGDTVSVKRS